MHSFEIINVNSKKWNEIVRSSFIHDFHHTAFYHTLENKHSAVMLYLEERNDFIALPLLIREIEGTEWFDATSVYGYCGPISNKRFTDLNLSIIKQFVNETKTYFQNNNIIAAFSRLHPLIDQRTVFNNFGTIEELNKTVSIDLTISPEVQRKQYRKSNKSELNQLRRKGFIIEEAKSKAEVDTFIAIYTETMDKVGAGAEYYFSNSYFHLFLKNSDFESKLLLAKFEGKIVAGAIFTISNKIMQYHLAGTSEEFMKDTPMKLILDEARLLGNTLNLQALHLGGGVGGQDSDSLFRFKSGFSKNFCQFSVWKQINDQEKYDFLVNQKSLGNSDNNYFPLYRS